MLQGESPEVPAVARATPNLENFGAISGNPALAISESLRNALSLTPGASSRPQVPAPLTPSLSSGPATKSKLHP